MRFLSRIWATALVASSIWSTAALAEFPERTVEIVVPAAAGQGSDILIRTLAAGLQKRWGVPVVVLNKTGGGGTVAEAYVANAPADGYTILSHGPSRTILAAEADPNAPYDVVNGLLPVTQLIRQPMVLFVNNDLPAKSVTELVDLAQKDPGALNYGTNGPGGPLDLSMKTFMNTTGTEFVEVAYASAGDMLLGMLSGEVSVAIASMGFSSQHIKGGTVTALGVADVSRSRLFPEVPTIAEGLGIDQFLIRHWQGAFVPAGTPDDVLAKLNADIVATLNDPEVRQVLEAEGFEIAGNTPMEFADELKRETEVWTKAMGN